MRHLPWLIAAALLLPASVHAQEYSAYQLSTMVQLDPRDRTRENGVRFVRLSLAESTKPLRPKKCDDEGKCPKGTSLHKDGSAGKPTADHPAILQTLENKRLELERLWGREVRLLETMRIMAPHIVGSRKLKNDRQLWIKNLPSHGKKVSKGCGRPENGCDPALWRERMAPNYVKFRDWAIQQVQIGYFPECADATPIAYGGKIDWPIAVKRRICILECGDKDTFWAHPGGGCELTDERTVMIYKAVKVIERRRAAFFDKRGRRVRIVDATPDPVD